METPEIENELNEYWSLLLNDQKKIVVALVQSFLQADEEAQVLQEPEAEYSTDPSDFPRHILLKLSLSQKTALFELIHTVGIEQYNRELDEAEAEFERGEAVPHEKVTAMVKQWVHGK